MAPIHRLLDRLMMMDGLARGSRKDLVPSRAARLRIFDCEDLVVIVAETRLIDVPLVNA